MPPLRGAGEHSLVGARRLLMMRRHNARFYVTLPRRRIVPRHRVAGFRRAFLAYLQSLLLLDASCPGSPVFRAFSTLSWSFHARGVWERRAAQPGPPSTDARLGTMIPANPAVDVHGCAQGTEYKHSFGSKPPVMPPAGPTHGRLITDASSSYRIGLPDPGLAPAAAIPKWASPLYPQKSPDSHWAPTSTDITGLTPPASFANIFMYKSIPAANLR